MQAFQFDTMVSKGIPVIPKLPLPEGQKVHVVIEPEPDSKDRLARFPLRGLPHKYIDPFEPAASPDDWDILRNGHS